MLCLYDLLQKHFCTPQVEGAVIHMPLPWKKCIFLPPIPIPLSKDSSQWKDYFTGLIKCIIAILLPKETTPFSPEKENTGETQKLKNGICESILSLFKARNIFFCVPNGIKCPLYTSDYTKEPSDETQKAFLTISFSLFILVSFYKTTFLKRKG